MQIHNAIITGSFSYNGADLSNVTSSNAYSASLSSRTTNLESTSSVLVGASASFSSILSSVSSSQQQLSASFLTLTASFNAVSASQQQISASLLQVSASYIALSGSYNVFSGSASTRITANSSSIQQVSSSQQQISSSQQQISASLLNVIAIGATTGSNSFRANQSITGSLVVSSTITAQTLVVQTVTSSIVYSSGSNIFGCDLNSRQTFTGSVLVTGSLTIAGASSATSYSGTTIFGSTIACSPIGCFATSCATSFIGGTGTLSGDLTLQGAVTRNIKFLDNTNTNLNAQIQYDQISSTSGQLLFGTNNAGTFATRLTISNTGAASFSSTITGTTIYGSTAVCSPVGKFSTCIDACSGYFSGNINSLQNLVLTRASTSAGSNIEFRTSSTLNWYIGTRGLVNNNFYIVNEGLTANNLILDASTGAATFACSVTINGASATTSLNVVGSGPNGILLDQDTASAGASSRLFFKMNTQTYAMLADSNGLNFLSGATAGSSTGSPKMTITSAGNVGIAVIATNTLFEIGATTSTGAEYSAYTTYTGGGTSSKYSFWRNYSVGSSAAFRAAYMANYNEDDSFNSNNKQHLVFATKSGTAEPVERMRITGGGITCFGYTVCAPCFATISDYRMKSNLRPIEGLSIIMNTKPYKFEYNYDCSTSFGMIAHELQDTLPEAVFGQKDGEVMQGVDYMKLLPIAIKAIQEQQCTICSQATMINQLKTCLGIN